MGTSATYRMPLKLGGHSFMDYHFFFQGEGKNKFENEEIQKHLRDTNELWKEDREGN